MIDSEKLQRSISEFLDKQSRIVPEYAGILLREAVYAIEQLSKRIATERARGNKLEGEVGMLLAEAPSDEMQL